MGPKKKKQSQKANDDWENELGEQVEATNPDTADTAQNGQDEDGGPEMGGGLLAAARKNKSKRAKKGKDLNDFVDGEDPSAANPDAAPIPGDTLAEKAPEEADADDIFAPVQSKQKGGKGKGANNQDDGESGNEGSVADGAAGLKTKKEKEKEKKEREKQRKKEMAAKKKSTSSDVAAANDSTETKADQAAATTPGGKADAGKKKKIPAGLAALQKQVEERRKREEEEEKRAAEEKARAAEEERQEAERSQKEAEAKARRKEKEREKKEEMRKAGTLLTKAQKEAKAAAERRKEQMLAAGAKVAGLEENGEEKKKPVYEKKKKGGKSRVDEEAVLREAQKKAEAENERLVKERERKRQEEEEKERAAAAAAAATDKPEEGSELDDWEAEAGAEEDDVKESWDADSDEDREKKKQAAEAKLKEKEAKSAAEKGAKANGVTSNGLPTRPKENGAETSSESSDSDDDERTSNQRAIEKRKAEAAARRQQKHEDALAARSKDNLRSPICCILGHVDTGKTKLLDKVRQTNVQEGEAGGITQQIGATYFPVDALQQKTAVVNKDGKFEFKVPGLLVIDTPGHESFTNLRSRGSSLCNIAILVVDIMHGLEPQTLESMRLLRDRKTPFIVALNKIDRLYGWKKIENNGFQDSLSLQSKGVQNEFRDRLEKTKVAFAEQGFNSELFYENKSMARNVSLVPTSAHTGEGVPDMLKLLVSLTQERMTNKLMYLSEVECTVLEVKVIEGLGTTIDVILSNGVLREGDRIVLCGLNGAISTTIRALLTPAPLKELRVKSQYVHNDTVKASLGVKIAANDLEHAIAGSRLLVVGPDDDEEDLEEEVMSDIEKLLGKVSKTGRGVSVQASTLGSLEALLEFLKVSKIPVANISIGPVYKRDVMQCGIMLEKAREYAVMLCFDVKIDKDAQAYADEVGVKIFTADIIYHLFDDFNKHREELLDKRKEDSKLLAVFPCVLNPVSVFNKKDPIVVGVDVVEGNLKLLTPIAAVKTNPITGVKEVISLGRVQSIEREHKQLQVCKKGQPSVAVKIEGPNQPGYGRQLEDKDVLYSLISRASIDTLKEFYRAEVSNEEWLLVKKLKTLFDIP